MARIYAASSWRNKFQQDIIKLLRENNHLVYDFKNPPEKAGFQWRDVEQDWQNWDSEKYRYLLETSPLVAHGFIADYRAMQWADICVLILPCGRSAHLEAGYFNGANKRLIIYIPEVQEPELMYLMANKICLTEKELINEING